MKPAVFLPAPNGETSVLRIDGVPDNLIWQTAETMANERNQTLYARADFPAETVNATAEATKVKVSVVIAEPPPRHANIIGWPMDDKDKRLLVAMQLANAASLALKE